MRFPSAVRAFVVLSNNLLAFVFLEQITSSEEREVSLCFHQEQEVSLCFDLYFRLLIVPFHAV